MYDRIIILNQIETPDGTILISHHRHDYKTYIDKNGCEYMVDGGRIYLRRNYPEIPYIEKTVYSDAPFEIIRQSLYWGTYGKDNKLNLHWVRLDNMSDEHIRNVIIHVRTVHPVLKSFFIQELKYRKIYKVVDK